MPSNPLSHYFPRIFHLASLRPPRDFYPIADTPICLEIGAGKGKHALLFAHQNPDKHLYAIERTAIKFGAFDKQAGIANPPNLTAIHADAIAWTAFAVYPKQLQTCFILYPTPNPKTKTSVFWICHSLSCYCPRWQMVGRLFWQVTLATISTKLSDCLLRCGNCLMSKGR